MFDLSKSIPSADAAAAIKFGVEKVPGVSKVHFVGDAIEVEFGVEGAAVALILDVLTEVGFPSAVAVGAGPLGDTSTTVKSPSLVPATNDVDQSDEAEAIA
ncbi:MAG TPA: hypothetical protein VK961_09075 [Chthoniobacter sp.]|nr:hypothetical protein [Chthoniobacter sp.]